MDIQEQRQGAVTVIKPIGPLVAADAEQFKQMVEMTLVRSLGRFIVDASAIQYADSRGLEVLAELTRDLQQSGQVLRLCGAGETLREVLELTELHDQFEHFQDVTTAVRSFL
jgi:anti-anti-sigma factor